MFVLKLSGKQSLLYDFLLLYKIVEKLLYLSSPFFLSRFFLEGERKDNKIVVQKVADFNTSKKKKK